MSSAPDGRTKAKTARVGRRHLVALVAAMLTTAACGSTVPGAENLSSAELEAYAGGDGLGIGGAGSAGGAGGPGAGGAGGGGTAGTTGTGPGGRGPGGTTGTTAPPKGAMGRGITNTTIAVGISWVDISAIFQAFAPTARNDAKATTKDAAQVVVDWMNKNGGIAGRKIVPIYHEYPAQAAAQDSTRSQAEQSMCDAFTQDNVVFAAMPTFSTEGVFNSCAAKRGLVSLVVGNLDEIVDNPRIKDIGKTWYRIDGMAGERREQVTVDQLHRRGFFAPGTRLGLLITNTPTARRLAETSLKPALKRIGVTPVVEATYTDADNMSSTVLTFSDAKVDRVMWGNCFSCQVSAANFMSTAEAQGFTPAYGLTTQNTIGALRTLGAPPAALERSVAFGWKPAIDLATNNVEPVRPGPPADCRRAVTEAGMADDFPPGYEGAYENICEALFFLKRGLEAAPSLTIDGMSKAVESFGDHVPVGTFATRFGPGRHDGVSAVRDLFFERACDCWKFRGPLHGVG
ncbi:MAG TPA: ABC transporter substrate-binding protein [Acidimicrobiales bacterium]|nr:ABC transporter substrate-binding protein [Acidimicrobiales bacterium]